jgi:hypothetical protein
MMLRFGSGDSGGLWPTAIAFRLGGVGIPFRRLSIKLSTACLGGSAAPLFEEERYVRFAALLAESPDPGGTDWSVPRARLAAGNEPVDSGQIENLKRAQQRLGADESDGSGNLSQPVRPVHESTVFVANAYPHVGRPGQQRRRLDKMGPATLLVSARSARLGGSAALATE